MNRITVGGIALLLVLLVLGSGSMSPVAQTEQVLLVQFGEIVRPIETPGLHAKLPLIQNVITFDRRLLNVELPGEEVILGDQRRLIVDTLTVYRITDPLRFLQHSGRPTRLQPLSSVVRRQPAPRAGQQQAADMLFGGPQPHSCRTTSQSANTRMQVSASLVNMRLRHRFPNNALL